MLRTAHASAMPTLPSFLFSLAPCVLLALCALPCAASAHDPNLARWDVRAEGESVVVELRTAGSGLYEAVQATTEADLDGQDVATWDAAIAVHLRNAVELVRGDVVWVLDDVQVAHGHEVWVVVTYERAPALEEGASTLEEGAGGDASSTAPLGLELDLSGYNDRSNQHHLVFVEHSGGRTRHMLGPGSAYTLRWPAGSASFSSLFRDL